MKKLFLALILCVITSSVFGSGFTDCPSYMAQDTLFVRTRLVHDFYFNSDNDSTSLNRIIGPVDYSILASVATSTDTAIVEVYGIVRKRITGSTSFHTEYVDSARVASFAISATSTFKTYSIDPLYVNFLIYDGIRIVLKKYGSDDDECTYYHNLRIWPQGR